MAAEVPGSTQGQSRPVGWRPWVSVVLAAAALLLLSEALWLWQTWPVRELLDPGSTYAPRKP
jgi:hypothetical protein